MKKYLQIIFLLFIISFSALTYAQTERLKTAQKQVISTNSTSTKNVVEFNKSATIAKEKPKVAKVVTTSTKPDANKTVPQKQTKDLRKPKVIAAIVEPTDNDQKQSVNVVNPDVNVTYTKEDAVVEPSISTVFERKPINTQKSVNYQPKVVKEDIHPITDYSNTSTPPNKKIYLQQEADDLQIEINQNANNPAYDLIAKQKQLDDIKKLIQQ